MKKYLKLRIMPQANIDNVKIRLVYISNFSLFCIHWKIHICVIIFYFLNETLKTQNITNNLALNIRDFLLKLTAR